jgi:hypothetical protein
MKFVLPILAVVALFAGQAMAADGNVSNDQLAKMGLSNMQVMSDAQGTAIRGMGYCGCKACLDGCIKFAVCASVSTRGAEASSNVSGKVEVSGKCVTIENSVYVSGRCGPIVAGSCFTLSVK